MINPLEDIENRKAQEDLGIFAYRIYKGARDDGATHREAFTVVVAWFKAMLTSNEE